MAKNVILVLKISSPINIGRINKIFEIIILKGYIIGRILFTNSKIH